MNLNIKICARCNTAVNGCLCLTNWCRAKNEISWFNLLLLWFQDPPHVLTSCGTYILPLANQRHCACVEKFWRTFHPHFKWAPLARALLGGLTLFSTRREITSMSPVMCSSEYCTIFYVEVQGKSTTRRRHLAPYLAHISVPILHLGY